MSLYITQDNYYSCRDVNPFQYVLSQGIVGGKFNKSISILQEFDLDFQFSKSKKFLVFAEPMSKFPSDEVITTKDELFPYEHIFLISLDDPWYRDILIYLHTLKHPATFLHSLVKFFTILTNIGCFLPSFAANE